MDLSVFAFWSLINFLFVLFCAGRSCFCPLCFLKVHLWGPWWPCFMSLSLMCYKLVMLATARSWWPWALCKSKVYARKHLLCINVTFKTRNPQLLTKTQYFSGRDTHSKRNLESYFMRFDLKRIQKHAFFTKHNVCSEMSIIIIVLIIMIHCIWGYF